MFEKLKKALLKKGAARRLYGKFTPKSDLTNLSFWVEDADPDFREDVAELHTMQPGEILRIGNKLSQVTKTRKNPLTGEREFLLHRGVGKGEHKTVYETGAGYNMHTSWTPKYNIAVKFARDYALPHPALEHPDFVNKLIADGRVKSAWIPESSIAFSPKQHKYGDVKGYSSPYSHEYEIIVKPFKPQLAEKQDLDYLKNIGLEEPTQTNLKERLRNKFKKSLAFHLEKMQKTHIPNIEGKELAQFFQDFAHHRAFTTKDDAIDWITDHTQSANNIRDFRRDTLKSNIKRIDIHKDILPFIDIIHTQDGYKIKAIGGRDTPPPLQIGQDTGQNWEKAYHIDVFNSYESAMHEIEKSARNKGLMPKDVLAHVRVAITPKGYKIIARAAHTQDTAKINELSPIEVQLQHDIITGPEHIPRNWRNHHHDLIDGLMPDNVHGTIEEGITPGVRHAKHSNSEHPGVIVKPPLDMPAVEGTGHGHFANPNFTTSHREAAYHKMAEHVFGLGDFVPKTTVFYHPVDGKVYSAQEFVPNTRPYSDVDPDHRDNFIPTQDAQKLAIMNSVLGNNDRHSHNILITSDEKIKLIDHGLSFDYGGPKSYGFHRVPVYAKYIKNIGIYPEVHAWIDSLDSEKMKQHLAEAQVPANISAVAINRLNEVKSYSKKLREGRLDIYDDAPGIVDATKLHFLDKDGNLRQASEVDKDRKMFYGKTMLPGKLK